MQARWVNLGLLSSLLVFVTGFAAAFGAQETFQVRDGDRVVFYGDSITEQRLYTTDVESFILTRFPKFKAAFIQSGWTGDRVSGGGGGSIKTRLHRDVIAFHPDIVTIMLGMNDGAYRPFDHQIFEQYTLGYDLILQILKRELPGLRVTLIAPSPHDDFTRAPVFPGGYNDVMERYSKHVKKLAARENLISADFNTPMVAVLREALRTSPNLAAKLIPDRVHPGPALQMLMAGELLKAWNAPALVSSAILDGRQGSVIQTTGCAINHLEKGTGLAWDQLDQSLPMPLDSKDETLALVLSCSDFLAALDQETLKIANLEAARYRLIVDGRAAGVYSKESLSTGINLATKPTPMLDQSMAVHELTMEHNDIHFARWRQVQMRVGRQNLARLNDALRALDGVEEEIVGIQRRTAQPVSHHFELVPDLP